MAWLPNGMKMDKKRVKHTSKATSNLLNAQHKRVAFNRGRGIQTDFLLKI